MYSEVKTFMKNQPNVIDTYLEISTLENRTVSLSSDHLIYTRKSNDDKFYPV